MSLNYIYTSLQNTLRALWVTVQAKNSARNAPVLALHLAKTCTEATTSVLQIITYAVREKGVEHKGEQRGSFGRTMMQALELLRLAIVMSPGKVTLNSEEIDPVAVTIIKLCLS